MSTYLAQDQHKDTDCVVRFIYRYWVDVHDGEPDITRISDTSYAADDVAEAIEWLKNDGLSFAATGSDWAADPDGSFCSDYATGEECEKTAFLSGAWTDHEIAQIINEVG